MHETYTILKQTLIYAHSGRAGKEGNKKLDFQLAPNLSFPILLILLSKTSKELWKPQRPTALHVTTRVFKRYNDLRSTSQSTQ